ncbi:MAG TPA: DoxX family protein [Pyrinomonadaceae bacterium]|nr:DoxX family protein [Pyrinomonadaceae bacterium]
MDSLNSFFAQWSPRVLSVLRIVVAFLFIAHGSQKLFGYPSAPPPPQPQPQQSAQPAGPPPPQPQTAPAAAPKLPPLMMVAGVLETFGGLLVLLGLFTRPIAFILSGEMAVAYFMQHAPNSFWPLLNKGEAAVLFCFIFLYLAVAGGGLWSLDSLLKRNKNI